MKLLRYGPKNNEKPGMLDNNGRIRSLSVHLDDITAEILTPERLTSLATLDNNSLPLVEGSPRLGTPVSGIGKIVAIGLNYADHARETGAKPPIEPRIFTKATTALNGPNDPIVLPKESKNSDWEVELAVIIGTRALYVKEDEALDYVAGYSIMNDVSEREYQKNRGGQWLKGKSFDTFAPMGPWLVTKDEIKDPQNLDLWLDVNGNRRQQSNTSNMTFGVAFLVSYVSQFMSLMPGDVITTGTPPGVGLGMKPPTFLKAGDNVRLGVASLGEQHQQIKAWQEQ